MGNTNTKTPCCNADGDYFNLIKAPVIIDGFSLYICECGSCYGVKSGLGLDGDITELKRLSELAGKWVTVMYQDENGLWFSDGFLDF